MPSPSQLLLGSTAPVAYPALLQVELAHARRFVTALQELGEASPPPEDAALLWLEGRAEEVAVFVVDVLRAWERGDVKTTAAARTIHDYLRSLHSTLEGWFGQWYAPSCCGPFARDEHEAVSSRPPFESPPRRRVGIEDTNVEERPLRESHVSLVCWTEIGNVK
jgi:hypothetical protein